MRALASRRAVSAMGPNEALALATNQLKQMNLMKSNRNTSGWWRGQGKTRGSRIFLDIFEVHLAPGIRYIYIYIYYVYIYMCVCVCELVLVGSCWHLLAAWFPPLSKPSGSKRCHLTECLPPPCQCNPQNGLGISLCLVRSFNSLW
jgi:hypothetical protein